MKVRGKTFLFMRANASGLHLGVKLPSSAAFALTLPNVERSGYGLGASGWVTAHFAPRQRPEFDLLENWIVESNPAVAPKTLAARLAAPRCQ